MYSDLGGTMFLLTAINFNWSRFQLTWSILIITWVISAIVICSLYFFLVSINGISYSACMYSDLGGTMFLLTAINFNWSRFKLTWSVFIITWVIPTIVIWSLYFISVTINSMSYSACMYPDLGGTMFYQNLFSILIYESFLFYKTPNLLSCIYHLPKL